MPDASAAKPNGAARALLHVAGLGLALRLLRLDLPILEFYGERQIQTAEITRNLWREGFGGFLFPHVYWQGREAVYFVLEFPLYNALVASLYALTGGVREVLGRLVSIAAWVGGPSPCTPWPGATSDRGPLWAPLRSSLSPRWGWS